MIQGNIYHSWGPIATMPLESGWPSLRNLWLLTVFTWVKDIPGDKGQQLPLLASNCHNAPWIRLAYFFSHKGNRGPHASACASFFRAWAHNDPFHQNIYPCSQPDLDQMRISAKSVNFWPKPGKYPKILILGCILGVSGSQGPPGVFKGVKS